jgi:hypothetical protein
MLATASVSRVQLPSPPPPRAGGPCAAAAARCERRFGGGGSGSINLITRRQLVRASGGGRRSSGSGSGSGSGKEGEEGASGEAVRVLGASLKNSTWALLREDAHVLVVDKGAGLLTVPGIGRDKADCLLSRLRAAGYADVSHAAHRLGGAGAG